jgi:hypothetical protein
MEDRKDFKMNLPNYPRARLVVALLSLVMALFVGMLTHLTIMRPIPALAEAKEPAAVPLVVWSQFRYINISGSTLRPRASATDWTYPGGGCISASGANDIFNIHLPVPHGSRIDYLRLYYYDTSAGNSRAWVTTYNGAGVANDVTAVDSTGNAGYGTTLSPYVGHVVNTVNNSYVLNWRANQTGSTMRLCGLRVAYRDPLDQVVYLPLVVR